MKNNVLNFLKSKEVKKVLNEYAINHLYLFWSYARNEETKNSDLDLIIDYDRSKYKLTLLDLVKIEKFFKNNIAIDKVDLVTKKSINKHFSSSIKNDIIKIY